MLDSEVDDGYTNDDNGWINDVYNYMYCTLYAGVPGVKPERLGEGMTVRHCALSLVGTVLFSF